MVKPYGLRYPPPNDLAQTNIVGSKHPVEVANARLCSMDLDDCGFTLTPFSTAMAYEDYEDVSKIKSTYCQEIAAFIKDTLGIKHARVLDFSVRCHSPLSCDWM